MKRLELIGLENIGEVKAGDSLAELIVAACSVQGIELADNDVLVVAQKIVSKAEGRTIKLKSVQPSERAQQLAAQLDKEPELVEVILGESRSVIRSGGQGLDRRNPSRLDLRQRRRRSIERGLESGHLVAGRSGSLGA